MPGRQAPPNGRLPCCAGQPGSWRAERRLRRDGGNAAGLSAGRPLPWCWQHGEELIAHALLCGAGQWHTVLLGSEGRFSPSGLLGRCASRLSETGDVLRELAIVRERRLGRVERKRSAALALALPEGAGRRLDAIEAAAVDGP